MVEKIKKVKAANVGELMHHYVTAVNERDTRGSYSYKGNQFLIDNHVYGKIISRKLKIAIIQPFDRSGGWGGGGYSNHNLEKAFPNDWTILKCSRLSGTPDNYEEFDTLTFKAIILDTIYSLFKSKVELYVKEKYLLTSNSFREVYEYKSYEDFNEFVTKLCKKLIVPKKDILNHIYNSTEYITVNWSGWTKTETERYKIDKPIKFYLDKSKWHTVEEQDVIEFKKWKNKYFNLKAIQSSTFYRQGRTYEQIWKDKEFKAEFEKNIEAGYISYISWQEQKRKQQQEEELKKSQEKVLKWLQGDNISNLWNIPIHLRIKDNRIETTRNAVIPFEAGKQMFQIFNKVRQGSIDKVFTLDKFKVGFYDFNKIHYIDGHWYVVIGCHSIRDTEIDLFINKYNLEEWKQMK